MPEPSTFPDWDTNGTHTLPLVAAHTTDGFIADEVPASDELNTWMMLVGQWIRYLASFTDNLLTTANEWTLTQTFDVAPVAPDYYITADRTRVIPASAGQASGAGGAGFGPYPLYDATTGVLVAWTFHNDVYPVMFPIPVEVGEQITGYTARIRKTSNGAQTVTMKLVTVDYSGVVADADTANSTATTSANAPGYVALNPTLVPTVAVADGTKMYYLLVHTSGAVDDEDFVLAVEVSYKRPAP